VKCDGYLNTRARQVLRLVLRHVSWTVGCARLSAREGAGRGGANRCVERVISGEWIEPLRSTNGFCKGIRGARSVGDQLLLHVGRKADAELDAQVVEEELDFARA
jgi:hypothetical protein